MIASKPLPKHQPWITLRCIAAAILLGWSTLASAQQIERLPAVETTPSYYQQQANQPIDRVGYDAYGGAASIEPATYPTSQASAVSTTSPRIASNPPPPTMSPGSLIEPSIQEYSIPTGPMIVDENYQPGQGYESFARPQYARPEFEPWTLQVLPSSIIYKSYLAGAKESRFAAHILHVDDDLPGTKDTMWDATLGTRVGLLRYGTRGDYFPQGFQIDAEGSAQVRLDIFEDVDVTAVDFRAGVPFTYGVGDSQFKFGYYHLSSHLGDEFQLKNPAYERLNFARDVLIFGYSVYPVDDIRLYAEAGWAFFSDANDPWEFQFGIDYAPMAPTGICGAPFFAINAHLRQEHNYSGNLTVQTGWAWRADEDGRLLRMGVHYLYGKSNHFSFAYLEEEQIGFGLWYDF